MITYVLADFEGGSLADLRKTGAWRYAEDPTTEIICLGFNVNGGEPTILPASDLMYHPDHPLARYVNDPTVMFIAHNAGFEKAIWRNIMMKVFHWPNIPNSRWHDSLAVCAMKALPLKLETAAKVLHLREQKDPGGLKAVKAAYKSPTFDNLKKTYDYNAQDVRAETELDQVVGGFQPGERNVWLLDQRINERGVRIDMDYVNACQKIVDDASKPLLAEFVELTGIPKLKSPKLKTWLSDNGLDVANLRKETITALLGATDDEEDSDDEFIEDPDFASAPMLEMSAPVRRALEIRRTLGSASIKKLIAFRNCVCADGRVRGALQYHVAGPGRWGGRLFQPQNFPRDATKLDNKPVDPELMASVLGSGDYKYVEAVLGDPIAAVQSGLRHAIIASDGRVLNVGDYNTIEARVVLALGGADSALAVITDKERDVYCEMAAKIFKVQAPHGKAEITEWKENKLEWRQTGKNTVLGCGFQMGWEKFKARYAPNEPDEFAKLCVKTYREEFAPEVPKIWWALDEAALRCAWDKTPQEAYGVLFQIEGRWMTARLPSGRKLYYFNPQPARKMMKWSTKEAPDVRPVWTCQAMKMGRWITRDMYGGLLTENVVQALARDLLVHSAFLCEKENFPLVLTVHDEIVSDAERDDPKMLEQLMTERPAWAINMNIPVAAECWAGERYRK